MITSPIRPSKIIQGRTIWESTGGNRNERLHEFFKYAFLPEDGYSQNELAFIKYAKELKMDNRLGKEALNIKDLPELEALRLGKYRELVRQSLNNFRNWLENEHLILVTEKTENGEMIVYNVVSKESVDESNKKLNNEEEGLKIRQERHNEIHKKGRRKRLQLSEKLSNEIRLRNQRKNKKRYGDFGKGE